MMSTHKYNIGDLVRHNPAGTTAEHVRKLYQDWGHAPDFELGIIVEIQDAFALIYRSTHVKAAWYKSCELELLSARR